MLEARLPTASASVWRLDSPESCTRVQCFVIYHEYASMNADSTSILGENPSMWYIAAQLSR